VLSTILAVATAVLLAFSSKFFYSAAGKSNADYLLKLGELTMQLALIAVLGAVAKGLIDWGTASHSRRLDEQERRLDFLRRVRNVHVTMDSATQLLNAHNSARTYGEQLRRLMALRPEIEEVSEDISAAGDLFVECVEIRDRLEAIARYLAEGADEYVRHHGDVTAGDALHQTLRQSIAAHKMGWIHDLMEGGPKFGERYVQNLRETKGRIRREIYG